MPEAEIKDQKLQKIVYETKGLKGAEYDLVAAETIPHPDGYSKDLYLMGTTIAHVITDEQGKAVLSDLPLGRYEIRETKAPSGYTRKQKDAKRNTELLWKDSADLEITATETFFNERQKIDIGQEPDGPEVSPTVPEEPGTIIGEEWKGRTGVFKKCVDGERKQAGRSRIHTLCEKRYYGRKRKCCAAGRNGDRACHFRSERQSRFSNRSAAWHLCSKRNKSTGWILSI